MCSVSFCSAVDVLPQRRRAANMDRGSELCSDDESRQQVAVSRLCEVLSQLSHTLKKDVYKNILLRSEGYLPCFASTTTSLSLANAVPLHLRSSEPATLSR